MAFALARRTLAVAFAATALAVGAASPPQQAAARVPVEYEIKAQYLLNFLLFITWPPAAFAGPQEPFRVCLAGANPFGAWTQILDGEQIEHRRVVVQTLKREEDVRACRLVFVPKSQEVRLPVLVRQARQSGVLIVTESPATLDQCAGIALDLEDTRVRFHVNVGALRHHGLIASSKLLHVARDRVDETARCASK